MYFVESKGWYIAPLYALGFIILFHAGVIAITPGCELLQIGPKCVEYRVSCNRVWEFKRFYYTRGDFGCYNPNVTVNGILDDIDIKQLNSSYFGTRDINTIITHLTITGKINALMKNVFYAMSKMEKLSLKNCCIQEIKSKALSNLFFLKNVDLSYNSIANIDQSTFTIDGESQIEYLDLSHNKLHILNLDILLPLVKLKELHLENNLITEIDSTNDFTSGLILLFLQNNRIQKINPRSGVILKEVKRINLSYNDIRIVKYNDFENCQKLIDIDLSYNKIVGTINTTFVGNLFLSKIDFSGNNITNISINEITHLSLEYLNMSGNQLSGELSEATFEGLLTVKNLDLSSQRITRIGSKAFIGAPNLANLNLRNNSIHILENNCFASLTKLKLLDISYNNISSVCFDTSSLYNVEEFYARNNMISKIEYDSLKNMKSLRILDVCFNKLKQVDAILSIHFPHLETIRLCNNHLFRFPSFEMNRLIEIDAGYNSIAKVEFDKCNTSTFRYLILADNNITTIKINNKICRDSIELLDLSRNSLTTIGQNVLGQNLLYFNASFNNISQLFPGQFMASNNLKLLNLSHNIISELSYGVFNGLNKISILDLSFNRITRMDESLMHPIQNLNSLILDYNRIQSLNIFDLIDHLNISKLSVGGNQIPCYFLAKVIQIGKKQNVTNVIDSIHKQHLAENINGILCNHTHSEHKSVIGDNLPVSESGQVALLFSTIPTVNADASASGHSVSFSAVEGCFICLIIISTLMAVKTLYRFYLNRYANNHIHSELELMPN